MGCTPSSTSAVKKITVQPPDEKVRLRLRLRGDIPSVNGDMIHKTVADVVGIPPKRLEVTSSEEQTGVYFVTIFPDPGDEPGQVRRYMRQIIGQACGKGILIEDKVKIIGAKEYMDVADMED